VGFVDSTILGSNQALGKIRGFFGGPAFKRAVSVSRSVGSEVLAGARGSSWKGFAMRAGASGAIGGGLGYAKDRDVSGAVRGAGLGVLAYGGYRAGRGVWGSRSVRAGMSEARSAAGRLGNRAGNWWSGRVRAAGEAVAADAGYYAGGA
jgi:hypothetical protein